MVCKGIQQSSRYKYYILMGCCLSNFLRSMFITGTLPVLSVYYRERFTDRKLSSLIGTIQNGATYGTALPAMFLCQKIGSGYIRMLGALLTCVGMIATAFTTQAWQALLTNGIITGIGGAFLLTSSYSMASEYFRSGHIGPYAAMHTSFGLGTVGTAKTLDFLIKTFGFQNTLIICGSIMLVNVISGFLYSPLLVNTEADNAAGKKKECKYSLKSRKSGVFLISLPSSTDQDQDKRPTNSPNFQKHPDKGESEKKSNEGPSDNQSIANSLSTPQHKMVPLSDRAAECDKIIDPLVVKAQEETRKLSLQRQTECQLLRLLKMIWEQNETICYLIAAGLAYGGHCAFNGNLGDYQKVALEISSDDYSIAITLQGLSRLAAGIIYIIASQYLIIDPIGMFTVTVGLHAVTILLIITQHPGTVVFTMLMMMDGCLAALWTSSGYGCVVYLASVTRATKIYIIESVVDGFFIVTVSILAAHLQVEVNIDTGFYAAVGIMSLSFLLMLRTTIKTFSSPKIFNPHDGHSSITMTQFIIMYNKSHDMQVYNDNLSEQRQGVA